MDAIFTILIPYHTHPETVDFLKRQLNYYDKHSIPIKVVIALSGEKILKKDLQDFVENLNNKNFKILSITEENIKNVRSWVEKIFKALQVVETQYVAINGADDVLFPEQVLSGCKVLNKHSDVAAIKGNTVYFHKNSGRIMMYRDLPILGSSTMDRLKEACRDLDSIFYIISRTKDLLSDYRDILQLCDKSTIVSSSFYHIEHFKALRKAGLGKVEVLDMPWRIQTSHDNNHASHTPASFVRVKLGIIDKKNYQWFQSVSNNLKSLSYYHYKFLWVCHQITGVSVSFKQIVYECLYKNFKFLDFIRISSYYIFNKFYRIIKKMLNKERSIYKDNEDFINDVLYVNLKKYFFSPDDIKNIESYNK